MYVRIIIILNFSFLVACSQGKNDINNENANVDEDKIKVVRIKGESQSKIILEGYRNSKQVLILDSLHRLIQVENIIKCPLEENYVNTIMSFDLQGNIDLNRSFFYETYLSYEKSQVFVNCVNHSSFAKGGNSFILKGVYDEFFNLLSGTVEDTVWFNGDGLSKVPLQDWTKGRNNIRFIIVERFSGQYRRTYVSKDFFLK